VMIQSHSKLWSAERLRHHLSRLRISIQPQEEPNEGVETTVRGMEIDAVEQMLTYILGNTMKDIVVPGQLAVTWQLLTRLLHMTVTNR
jgi:hypothetical protein